MKRFSLTHIAQIFFLVFFAMSVTAHAEQAPDEIVRDAVDKLVTRIDNERDKLEEDSAYAEKVVGEELEDLVDFRRITRAVMGQYFGDASREQRNEFLKQFRSSLVSTYSAGITMYDGQDYKVLPMAENDLRDNRARVKMEFKTEEGKTLPIAYTMTKSNDDWKVDNVIVNGLNLGRVFQEQFAQDMEANNNDLDKVINNWSGDLDMEELKEEVE